MKARCAFAFVLAVLAAGRSLAAPLPMEPRQAEGLRPIELSELIYRFLPRTGKPLGEPFPNAGAFAPPRCD